MTPNWTWTLKSQKYPVNIKYVSLRPKCWSILLYDQRFSRYRVAENQKCTEWPQIELDHLTDKSNLYALNTYPCGPNFVRFALRPAVFEIQGCWKSEISKCTEWPQIGFGMLRTKSTSYTLNNKSRGPNLGPFCCTTSSFWDTNWILNSQTLLDIH